MLYRAALLAVALAASIAGDAQAALPADPLAGDWTYGAVNLLARGCRPGERGCRPSQRIRVSRRRSSSMTELRDVRALRMTSAKTVAKVRPQARTKA
jgi:hypothetical protein